MKVRLDRCDSKGIRNDLLQLRDMVHTSINGASLIVISRRLSLADTIADLIAQIDQYVANLLFIRNGKFRI